MDLKKEILKEHFRAQIDKIVDYVGPNPGRMEDLVNVYLEGPISRYSTLGMALSIVLKDIRNS